MNWIDFTIIYLACGAPFAVYYFLQNKTVGSSVSWLLNCLVLLLWLPFAIFLLTKNRQNFFSFNFFNKSLTTTENGQQIYLYQKQIEKVLLESDLDISIFDFRETAERYAGLTLAAQCEPGKDWGQEIFRVSGAEQLELGTICLQRRNRKRLAFHQSEARRDFLQIIERLTVSISDAKILEHSTLETVKLLKDATALEALEKMFARNLQTGKLPSVEYSENDLWNPQEHKPLHAKTLSHRL